jgi:hypothetical protein
MLPCKGPLSSPGRHGGCTGGPFSRTLLAPGLCFENRVVALSLFFSFSSCLHACLPAYLSLGICTSYLQNTGIEFHPSKHQRAGLHPTLPVSFIL